ncbi:MAG: GDSL-type esterase/lipase family protein [Cyanobacteria bacterium]|nr:GDSL-type esterase/lipase family protein [Cyanobacteriota bacterium]MDW8200247.1 GDSL-type esterase/lipase family protein [Cyanobacteriota bacterium SKYGB_h_bin112]
MTGLPLFAIGLLPSDPSLVPYPTTSPPTSYPTQSSRVTIPEPLQLANNPASYPHISSPEPIAVPISQKSVTLPPWQEPPRGYSHEHSSATFTKPLRDSYNQTPLSPDRPQSGGQLYLQRMAALKAGKLYTRLPNNSFREVWQGVTWQPTYQDWVRLLALEAGATARGQGDNRLAVLLGDSLSLWLPSDRLPSGQLWLNQSISGDTTGNVLKRLPLLANTRPAIIYVMVGINDLRRGIDDRTIAINLYQIARQLRQQHPQAHIVMQSILPTRYDAIPAPRVERLNRALAAIALHTNTTYMDLAADFSDDRGNLRRDLTTDGLHLSSRGYEVWQSALNRF